MIDYEVIRQELNGVWLTGRSGEPTSKQTSKMLIPNYGVCDIKHLKTYYTEWCKTHNKEPKALESKAVKKQSNFNNLFET